LQDEALAQSGESEDTLLLDWLESRADIQMWHNRNGKRSLVVDDKASSLVEATTFRSAINAAMEAEKK
jgi:hypothetical protein